MYNEVFAIEKSSVIYFLSEYQKLQGDMVHELTRDEKIAHGFAPNQVVIWVEGKPVLFELEETSIDLRTGKMENKCGPCSGGRHKECKGIGCSCSHKLA